MKIAVVIAFRGDPALLGWTLEGYASQILRAGHALTVWVGGDGVALDALERAIPRDRGAVRIEARTYQRCGAGAVRNRLIAEAAEAGAEIVIFGNSDARPAADMVQRHADRLAALPAGSLVLGAAPWELPARPSVFDALLAETPMIFFYGQLAAGQWYDYRHAWTLNLAARLEDLRGAGAAGPFVEAIRPVYYEDLAMGRRLIGARPAVYFDDGPRVLHRHPTTLDQYLNREELLGLMAPVVATHAPEVFADLWGGQSVDELAREFRAWVTMDAPSQRWVYQRLAEWAAQPEAALGAGEQRSRLLMTIYQMHVPLKRLAFRLGFLRGVELADDARWEDRQPAGLWKSSLVAK